jgi:hypothetical protein
MAKLIVCTDFKEKFRYRDNASKAREIGFMKVQYKFGEGVVNLLQDLQQTGTCYSENEEWMDELQAVLEDSKFKINISSTIKSATTSTKFKGQTAVKKDGYHRLLDCLSSFEEAYDELSGMLANADILQSEVDYVTPLLQAQLMTAVASDFDHLKLTPVVEFIERRAKEETMKELAKRGYAIDTRWRLKQLIGG